MQPKTTKTVTLQMKRAPRPWWRRRITQTATMASLCMLALSGLVYYAAIRLEVQDNSPLVAVTQPEPPSEGTETAGGYGRTMWQNTNDWPSFSDMEDAWEVSLTFTPEALYWLVFTLGMSAGALLLFAIVSILSFLNAKDPKSSDYNQKLTS